MASNLSTYNFTDRVKGDTSQEVQFTLANESDVAIDLTGATIRMFLRKDYKTGTKVKSFSIGSGITVTNASGGIFRLDAFICDIEASKYHYDIEITFSSGKIATYLTGIFNVLQDITY